MSIQGLLQKGRNEAPLFEKMADGVLAFPRAMWLNRKVQVITSGKNPEIKTPAKWDNLNKRIGCAIIPPNEGGGMGDGFILLAGGIALLVLNILASPFLGVGLIFKKIALATNKKGNAYNQLVEKAAEKALFSHEKQQINTKKQNINAEIHTLGLISLPQEPKQAKNDAEKIIPTLRKQISNKFNVLSAKKDQYEQSIEELAKKEKKADQEVQKLFEKFKTISK